MRRFRLFGLFAVFAALALPLRAEAQNDSYFGPQVGLFFPSSQALRDGLGDSWFSFGASRIRTFDLDKHKLAYDWQAISQRRNGNTIFILTGSIGHVQPLAEDSATTQPYFAIRGGVAYIDYAVDTTSGRAASKRLSLNGNAAVGVNISRRVNIEARYDVWNSFDGLTFDGLTLSVSVGLFRF